MVSVIIYVEGGNVGVPSSAIDSSTIFRENFHRLLSQIPGIGQNLRIQVIGSISYASKYLERINEAKEQAVLLVDLDGPPAIRAERVSGFYAGQDVTCLFFMVQEMESWILSQPSVLDVHASNEHLKRVNVDEHIGDNLLLKGKHPQDINDPATKLDTLFRQYFKVQKVRDGKLKYKPKSYEKNKDGPQLIGLLDFDLLKKAFEDADRLGTYLARLTDENTV
jgi:hypothetical protein